MNKADILYGMILGDGHLDKTSKRRPGSRLTICQGIKQLEYLEHKSEIITDLGFENTVKIQKIYERSSLPSVQLRTLKYPELTQVRAELYAFRNTPDKYRKRLTKNIIRKFSLTTLLYLYLDDGNNSKEDGRVSIYTCDFPYEEQEMLRDWIGCEVGIKMNIYRKREHFYLCSRRGRDAEIFKESLKPIFPPIECMQYKFIQY